MDEDAITDVAVAAFFAGIALGVSLGALVVGLIVWFV